MTTGHEQPDSGTLKIGDTVSLAYVDQSRDSLDPDKTIWEAVSGGEEKIQLGDMQVNSWAYVARFNFTGTEQQKKVGLLSGGERKPGAPGLHAQTGGQCDSAGRAHQ